MNSIGFIILWIIVTFLLYPFNVFANDDKNDALQVIKNIEGVYKYRFTNGLVSGEKYTSEDIVEIVSYSQSAIYFRAELKFSNAHFCSIYGIAEYQNQSFIYKRKTNDVHGEACVLKLSIDEQKIKISDLDENKNSTCTRYYCGARGTLHNYEIARDKKRKIRYMPIILKSSEYASAVEEYKGKN